MDWPAKVREFMRKHKLHISSTPYNNHPAEVKLQRIAVMTEEFAELVKAMQKDDAVGVLDGGIDTIYTVLGCLVALGFSDDQICSAFSEVHRSNMTKGLLNSRTAKGGKGEGFEPPDLASITLRTGVSEC